MLGALGGVTIVVVILQAMKGLSPMGDRDDSLSRPLLVFWILFAAVAMFHEFGVPSL